MQANTTKRAAESGARVALLMADMSGRRAWQSTLAVAGHVPTLKVHSKALANCVNKVLRLPSLYLWGLAQASQSMLSSVQPAAPRVFEDGSPRLLGVCLETCTTAQEGINKFFESQD